MYSCCCTCTNLIVLSCCCSCNMYTLVICTSITPSYFTSLFLFDKLHFDNTLSLNTFHTIALAPCTSWCWQPARTVIDTLHTMALRYCTLWHWHIAHYVAVTLTTMAFMDSTFTLLSLSGYCCAWFCCEYHLQHTKKIKFRKLISFFFNLN